MTEAGINDEFRDKSWQAVETRKFTGERNEEESDRIPWNQKGMVAIDSTFRRLE